MRRGTGDIVVAPITHSTFVASDPHLLWADLLVICAGILLALSLVILAVSWDRHFSRKARLSALLPLAASVAAEIAAHHLYDTYAGWAGFLAWRLGGSMTEAYLVQLIHELATANQEASVLGWIGVIVTGILLAVVLLGWWRLVALGRARRQVSVSFAAES